MIKRITIRNYKSIGDITVDFGPVTVLIGRSGTGKTNFVEALLFLRDLLLFRNDAIVQQQFGGWGRLMSVTAKLPIQVDFFVTFDAPGVTGDFDYEISFR